MQRTDTDFDTIPAVCIAGWHSHFVVFAFGGCRIDGRTARRVVLCPAIAACNNDLSGHAAYAGAIGGVEPAPAHEAGRRAPQPQLACECGQDQAIRAGWFAGDRYRLIADAVPLRSRPVRFSMVGRLQGFASGTSLHLVGLISRPRSRVSLSLADNFVPPLGPSVAL